MASLSSSSRVRSRTCMCAPTEHPGSFRCTLHRGGGGGGNKSNVAAATCRMDSYYSMKKALTAILLLRVFGRPSKSNVVFKPRDFHPKPSRFFFMHSCKKDR
ncbi:hypothetical protein H6P81_005511 [Aristolochia fimbriata]|uniref:Uncharacterized protein n=1 Tax=Aristolochia fimbriata TaxID=158543 RepID=A0AAV7EY74_ARIFI|nr:hypothetical protein H6P81_005511 [Aristolochia fimbriata]